MLKHQSANGSMMYVFDGLTDMISFVDQEDYKVVANNGSGARGSWVGRDFQDWCDVDAATKQAWDEGIQMVTMSIERLKQSAIPDIKSTKREPTFNNDGDGDFDYDRFMNGDPAFQTATRQASGEPNEVTIITDTSTPGHYDSMDALWRGAAALALTHILEEKGYRVELWVANQVSNVFAGLSTPLCLAVKLKKTSDPMDLSTLTNVVSGWYHRSATFSTRVAIARDLGTSLRRDYGFFGDGGYTMGQSLPPRGAELDVLSLDPHRIYSSGTFSFDAACRQIVAELSKFKIKDGPKPDVQ